MYFASTSFPEQQNIVMYYNLLYAFYNHPNCKIIRYALIRTLSFGYIEDLILKNKSNWLAYAFVFLCGLGIQILINYTLYINVKSHANLWILGYNLQRFVTNMGAAYSEMKDREKEQAAREKEQAAREKEQAAREAARDKKWAQEQAEAERRHAEILTAIQNQHKITFSDSKIAEGIARYQRDCLKISANMIMNNVANCVDAQIKTLQDDIQKLDTSYRYDLIDHLQVDELKHDSSKFTN